ncbi:hypothetical protein PR048_011607 [Dryococelus australis]|uniref:Uncharacterized protein n=1 Tax=Dryococelus australis TaxID=614101 RepID=A0ABQ9HM84_9NEOP|nr:hypothetical protein PR048_011607 [Dryococelus australis]
MSAYTRQKAKSKYKNRIRLERASQEQSSYTHKTPHDRVKRCRERKINTKASERVNVDVFTQNKRLCPLTQPHPIFLHSSSTQSTLRQTTYINKATYEAADVGMFSVATIQSGERYCAFDCFLSRRHNACIEEEVKFPASVFTTLVTGWACMQRSRADILIPECADLNCTGRIRAVIAKPTDWMSRVSARICRQMSAHGDELVGNVLALLQTSGITSTIFPVCFTIRPSSFPSPLFYEITSGDCCGAVPQYSQ